MGTQIIHDQVNRTFAPKGKHLLFPEPLAGIGILVLAPLSDRLSTRWAKSSKPLQGSIAAIAVRPLRGLFPPRLSSSRNGLKRSQFIKTDDDPFPWRMTIKIYDGVFFTSKSGSICFSSGIVYQEALILLKLGSTSGISEVPGCRVPV